MNEIMGVVRIMMDGVALLFISFVCFYTAKTSNEVKEGWNKWHSSFELYTYCNSKL